MSDLDEGIARIERYARKWLPEIDRDGPAVRSERVADLLARASLQLVTAVRRLQRENAALRARRSGASPDVG